MRLKFFYGTILISILFYGIIFVSCNIDKKKSKQNSSNEETYDMSAGKEIYKVECEKCHQVDGNGIPGAFPSLQGKQVDLNTIINGREGTIMKAFKLELSDVEITNVANYVNRSWNNNFSIINKDTIQTFK